MYFLFLTLSLELYCIALQQFWDHSRSTLRVWRAQHDNTSLWGLTEWGPDVRWTWYSVLHRLVLSSLSKTGTSNIETLHSYYCAASFVFQMCSSNTTIVDVTWSITSQLVHTYNFTRVIVIENNFKIMFVWTKMFIFICIWHSYEIKMILFYEKCHPLVLFLLIVSATRFNEYCGALQMLLYYA